MQVKDLKILYRWKFWKNPPKDMNKSQVLWSWITVKNNPGFEYRTTTWKDEQEEDLKSLQLDEIQICDTEFGKQANVILSVAITVIPHLSDTQVNEIKAELSDTPLATEATLPDTPLAIEAIFLDISLPIEVETAHPIEPIQEEIICSGNDLLSQVVKSNRIF